MLWLAWYLCTFLVLYPMLVLPLQIKTADLNRVTNFVQGRGSTRVNGRKMQADRTLSRPFGFRAMSSILHASDAPAWGPMKQKIAEPNRRRQEKSKETTKEAAATETGWCLWVLRYTYIYLHIRNYFGKQGSQRY